MFDFISFDIIDAIDIVVVALLLVQTYRMIRGTAALTIFIAIFLLYVLWIVVRILNMELLSMILGQVLGVGMLALIVVFQQEIRRYLLMLGQRISGSRRKWLRSLFASRAGRVEYGFLDEFSAACLSMASSHTGALIVLQQASDLSVFAQTGDLVDGVVSQRLIEAIFFKNSPMHDGAMIIIQGRVHSARCILPTSDNPNIPARFGLRHRAAMGLSEHSDAVVVVVSEESGCVSLVVGGVLTTLTSHDNLREKLKSLLVK
ncbi:MAG: diadenylate cyclase [Mucinivorans sp.]